MSGKMFYKNNETDKVMWLDDFESVGEFVFSFDGIKTYNMFHDYPYKLTTEEVRIFDKENPEWAEYFKDRKR